MKAIARKSGEKSGGNRAVKNWIADHPPPVWMIGPPQLTLVKLHRKAPNRSRVSSWWLSRNALRDFRHQLLVGILV